MKIVIATPLYPPDIGGPATYAKLLEEGLPLKGVEVELVKFSGVRHLPKLIRHYVYYRRVLRALQHADAVLALDPVSVGLPALYAAKKLKKPLIVKIVGDYAWEQGQQRFGVTQSLDEFVKTKQVSFQVSILRKIQTYVAEAAVRVIVPSAYLKGIVETWGITSEKISVIYNAALLDEIGTVPEAATRLPRPHIVSVGRLVPWKHFDGIIDAVAGTTASLAVIGSGPLHEQLAKYAKQKLGERALFTGTLSHADTLATIKDADVFVLNSSYEGLSHLLIETQMLGVPIIATKVGGNPEVITDGEDGLLVSPGDTPVLAQTLENLLSDEQRRARLAARAQKSAERFSMETMLSATARFLQQL